MSRDKRLKNRKQFGNTRNCQHCENCTYIGEGDYICSMTNEVILYDFNSPTEHYFSCKGKDFVKC